MNFFVTNTSLIFVANIRDNKLFCWKTQLYGIVLSQKIDYLAWYCIFVIVLINKYLIESKTKLYNFWKLVNHLALLHLFG